MTPSTADWRTAALADAAALPWRNGGGTTRELAAWPAGGDWCWRMSVAEVLREGPFSSFPGVTRWFAVLNGAGVQLDIAGRRHDLKQSGAPLAFDGSEACFCALRRGPTQDFNLMVQSHLASTMLRVIGERLHEVHPGATVAVYAIDTAASLTLNEATWTLAPGHLGWLADVQGGTAHVESGNALFMEICL